MICTEDIRLLDAIKEYRDPYNTPSEQSFDTLFEHFGEIFLQKYTEEMYERGFNDDEIINRWEGGECYQYVTDQLEYLLNPIYDN